MAITHGFQSALTYKISSDFNKPKGGKDGYCTHFMIEKKLNKSKSSRSCGAA